MKVKTSISKTLPRIGLIALASLSGSACTVGPNYQRPEMAHPQDYRGQVGSAEADSVADLPWWQVFDDDALKRLIATGLNNNYDLAIAASRIEQARALVGVARSEALPQVGYEGGVGGEKTFTPEPNQLGTAKYFAVRGALNFAWELDIWGRVRRSTEAARAGLFAQEEVRRGVLLSLVSEIASGYFRLLSLDQQLAIANESNTTYKKTLDLFTLRFQAGRDSRLAVERTEAAYESSNARIADLKQQIVKQEDALSILIGGYPQAITRGLPLSRQVVPRMPLGQTTDLLRRRPDIREAEQQMVRANAEIGVAVANFYPRIGLGALIGGVHVEGEHGLSGTFGLWQAAASLAGPIFTGGRLESLYNQRKAYWDESVAQYRKTILTAFQETSDALAAQQNLVGQRSALETQVQALRRSADLALLRYDAGRSSYFEVLEAQQQLFPAADELARTEQGQLQAMVDLYKALGGGWKLSDDAWARPG